MSAQPARDPYGRPYAPPQPVAAAPAARTSVVGLAARILLSAAGAACLIVGAFLSWIHGLPGTDLSDRAFYQTAWVKNSNFLVTVGFVMLVLGLLAIVGMAPRSGWLTSFAGVLGIVGFVLVVVQLVRAHVSVTGSLDIGAWLCGIGGLVALIGGFFG